MNTLYSSDKPDNGQAELDAKGFNLNIEQVTPVTNQTLDQSKQDGIVDAIVNKSATSMEHEERVLDELQQMDSKLNLDLPVGPAFEKSAQLAKKIFFATVIISILVIGAFAFANSNQFFAALGVVPANEDTEEKQSVANLQSQKIANHLLASAILLENIAVNSAKFGAITNSDTAVLSVAKKNNLKRDLTQDLSRFNEQMQKAMTELRTDPKVESELLIFMADQLNKIKTQISQATSDSLTRELTRKQSLLEDATKLARAKDLAAQIRTKDFTTLTDDQLLQILKSVLTVIDKNPLARVALVQMNRISWTIVLNELDTTFKKLDPLFDIFNPNPSGKIQMNTYGFSSETNLVTVNGQIMTPNDEVFSLIANTIDALETSPMFKDITYRTYQKTFQEGKGYTSSVNFSINLENNV